MLEITWQGSGIEELFKQLSPHSRCYYQVSMRTFALGYVKGLVKGHMASKEEGQNLTQVCWSQVRVLPCDVGLPLRGP